MEQIYDMIVIGGGPAGYTAALYAARSGLSVVVLEKLSAGGQMALTEQIDNYPGFEDGIDGFTLGEKMQQSAERFGAVTELAEVYKVSLSGRIKTLDTSEGVFQSRTVVIATGASPRPLGVPGEDTLAGKGVHYCAACDGAPYRGKTVAVVGGGNSAAADALTLSRIAQKVYLIHRRDSLRATKVYHEPLMAAPNVEFCWNSTVSALLHESRLTGLRLKDVNTGAERDLACDGVFISVGRAPATELFRREQLLDKSGYIVADESTRTNLPGVFAAMFMSEYNHTLDTKGRLIIPAKFREILGEEFVISKGMDGCLFVYANDDWNAFEQKLTSLPLINKEARQFARFFLAGAATVEVDKQGRILLPAHLREFAGLEKDVVLVGVGSRVEIWSKDKWENMNSDTDMDEITSTMEGLGLTI